MGNIRVKEKWDDYLTEELNEIGYKKIRNDAPIEIKKEYQNHIDKIKMYIDNNEPIHK